MYGRDKLIPVGYIDSEFMSNKDLTKSTFENVFTSNGGAVSQRSIIQKFIADSTTIAEYVATCEATVNTQTCIFLNWAIRPRIHGAKISEKPKK